MDQPRAAAEPDDRELARRVQGDADETAFLQLYERHTPRLYMFVLRLVRGAEHRAEDLVQETWIRSVRSLERFRWDSSFGTWLTAIALNCFRNELRRDRREEPLSSDGWDDPAFESKPCQRLDIERAISSLPEGYRTVLLLHDVEGYKHAEIAQMLDMTAGASKSQLFYARRKMRAWLTAETDSKEAKRR